MEPGAIFLVLGVFVIVVIFAAKAFTSQWRTKAQSGHGISALLAKRENTLKALQELDFDFRLGKVPAEEYSAHRANLLKKGTDELRQLVEIQGGQHSPSDEPVKLATPLGPPFESFSDEDLEDLIAKRRSTRQQKAAGFCPKCGKPILQSDRFCPACGQAAN